MGILWVIFSVIVLAWLIFDIHSLVRCKKSNKNAAHGAVVCITLTALFGILILISLGRDSALKFFTGYFVEISLSIDNLFVFMSILTCSGIRKIAEEKALVYGIIGAVVLRIIFLSVGVAVINKFQWLTYIFGIILISSAFGMFRKSKNNDRAGAFWNSLKKFFHIQNSQDEMSFFVQVDGKKYVTPLFVCVFAISVASIVFSADSIPAVISISRDPFIVISSNIFAILALRSLYTLLSDLVVKLKFLKYGIAADLMFVGVKMILDLFYEIPTEVSIFVILMILATSVILSLATTNAKKR